MNSEFSLCVLIILVGIGFAHVDEGRSNIYLEGFNESTLNFADYRNYTKMVQLHNAPTYKDEYMCLC